MMGGRSLVRVVVVILVVLATVVSAAVPMRWPVLMHLLWARAKLLGASIVIASSHGPFCYHVSTLQINHALHLT